jgi:hypothetical protein
MTRLRRALSAGPPITDSLLLDALDPCSRLECLSAGSVARPAPH